MEYANKGPATQIWLPLFFTPVSASPQRIPHTQIRHPRNGTIPCEPEGLSPLAFNLAGWGNQRYKSYVPLSLKPRCEISCRAKLVESHVASVTSTLRDGAGKAACAPGAPLALRPVHYDIGSDASLLRRDVVQFRTG